jgi:predicted MPP superfamily phosphohydrolase
MASIGLLVLLHLYIGVRLVPDLPPAMAAAALALWLLASSVLIPLAFFGRRASVRATADRWTWAGMTALGAFSMLLVLTLLRDVALLLAVPFDAALPPLAEPTALVVVVAAMAASALGFGLARRTPPVREVTIPIDDLPAALQGFTIAQISVLHVGPTVKRASVQRIVERVNALQADAVAITGDLVDGRVHDLAADVAPVAGLRSRHGSFFVTGNHEYYSGAASWVRELRRLGIAVLLNEHAVVRRGDARLVVAGVTDYSAGHFDAGQASDPQAALAGGPADAAVRVLLAHQPRSAAAAEAAGFDLQLSGHTHGGQFMPWNFLVRLQQPFTAGLHRWRRMWVYTSRGTGYWGPPKRFGAPSEITLLRLVAPPSARAAEAAAPSRDAAAVPGL